MRTVRVDPPSFPEVATDKPLALAPDKVWQVVCGDVGHWRVGMYSPELTSAAQCAELERHTCPEFFMLVSGRVSLAVFEDGGVRELPLEPGKPVLVTVPHSGFCPDGPRTGTAIVVERDVFETLYRTPEEWAAAGK